MSESYDYTPAPWAQGHSFTDARQAYQNNVVNRGYTRAVSAGTKASDLIPPQITTDSPTPVIIALDVTGSMGAAPAAIFAKCPYLDHEFAEEYLGPDYKICFMAVGDANSDRYPLQAHDFVSGEDIKKATAKLVIEGGGGGQVKESYDQAALYILHNITAPKTIRKPIVIFIGDEGLYEQISKDQAASVALVDLEQTSMSTKEVFAELAKKASVYLIKLPYDHSSYGRGTDQMSPTDARIRAQWAELIGENHIADLSDPERVVDVIFGLIAEEVGKRNYFEDELTGRQTKKQVDTVMRSLKTIHALPAPKTKTVPRGHSTMHIPTDDDDMRKL